VHSRRVQPVHESHDRWLVSYADFITLLFAFFVVMFASSQADRSKVKRVSESVKRALEDGPASRIESVVAQILGGTVDDKGKGNAAMKGPGGAKLDGPTPAANSRLASELLPSLEYLNLELKQEIDSGKMRIQLQPRGLVVSLQQATFFPSGEDAIAPDTYASLEKVATAIRNLPNPVRLEGHTDAIPIHTPRFRSNWELSAARAIAVLELLNGRFGVRREQLAIAGYAETMPVADNDSELGRGRNRRVDIVILSRLQALSEPAPAAPATGAAPLAETLKPPPATATPGVPHATM
jgi:chemotaxis protein MotB